MEPAWNGDEGLSRSYQRIRGPISLHVEDLKVSVTPAKVWNADVTKTTTLTDGLVRLMIDLDGNERS